MGYSWTHARVHSEPIDDDTRWSKTRNRGFYVIYQTPSFLHELYVLLAPYSLVRTSEMGKQLKSRSSF